MALEKDFLKKARRDVRLPNEDLKARVEADDPDDAGEVAESVIAAPEKPAETPAKVEAPEKPEKPAKAAESTPAPEKPAKAKPEPEVKEKPVVPVELMVSERKRADAAERRNEEIQRQLDEVNRKLAEMSKPKEPEKREPEDPEPDRKTKPIEWSEWHGRDLERKLTAANARLERVEGTVTARTQRDEDERIYSENMTAFEKILDAAAAGGVEERIPGIPDMKERVAFLREKQAEVNILQGMDETTARSKRTIDLQTLQFLAVQYQNKRNPIAMLSKLADQMGYKSKEVETETPAKPAPASKSASERIKDAQEREKAGRTAATMPGRAPVAASDEEMSMEKFMKMTKKEREAYKKTHKDFSLDKLGRAAEEATA